MADHYPNGMLRIKLNERSLSILVHSLFSSWMLAFLFEGQILYSLAGSFDLAPGVMVFGGISAIFAGSFSCGFFVKTKKAAKRLFLCSYPFFIAISILFFFLRPCSGASPSSAAHFWPEPAWRHGALPKKRHAEKRAYQNGRRLADPIKYPDDIAQYGGHSHLCAY